MRENGPAAGLVVLVALMVGIDVWWLEHFRSGFPLDIDESRYMVYAVALKDGLIHHGPAGFWNVWSHQRDFGPLLPLVSVPGFALLGDGEITGLAAQLFFLAVLIVSTYGIGARLTDRRMALVMALVVAGAPAVIDFSRSYQLALTGAAMMTATTYALLASEGLTRTGWSIAWGALMGLSSFARAMMLGFLPSLLLAAVWLAFTRPGERGLRRANLLIGCAAGALVALTWFALSAQSVTRYLTHFGYGAQSAGFGAYHSPLSLAFWTQEAVEATQIDLYLPLGLLLLVALVLGVAVGF
jgi:4-amino-4-deoxy-L-arabinose transferase-like glycosyltransferase